MCDYIPHCELERTVATVANVIPITDMIYVLVAHVRERDEFRLTFDLQLTNYSFSTCYMKVQK